jgi:hypothetical protein
MTNDPSALFFRQLETLVANKELIKLNLSNRRNRASDLKNIIVSLVELKGGLKLSFVYRHETNDITKNFEITEGLEMIAKAMVDDFFNADIFSITQNFSLIIQPSGKAKTKKSEPLLQAPPSLKHDRIKERLIAPQGNVYLRELGITNANGEVRHEMMDKYKQINRYIELLDPEIKELDPDHELHVVDMGAGKGYLTFALYDYLVKTMKQKLSMTGVEYRKELVMECNGIAKKSNFDALSFIEGRIENVVLDSIDILIALHACDTATDEAIFRGIQSNATLIVCAPCCHKQIRKEMKIDGAFKSILKHGILKERQAEIITDALRALIMEAFGYKTKVFEFIATEHTPKNLMIVGRKIVDGSSDKAKILNDIATIKSAYGIDKHYLEKLLGM